MRLPARAVDAEALLRRLLPDAPPPHRLGEGWDNVVYAVGDSHVLRVAKEPDPARRALTARKDAEILALAERHSSLAVPVVLAVDEAEGAILHTRVPGRPMSELEPASWQAAAATLGTFLSRLHTVPPVEAAQVVSPFEALEPWHAANVVAAGARVGEAVDAALTALVEAFAAEPLPEQPRRMVLCHSDLGAEHVMVDETSRTVCGVIDWSDAILGDPARDVALLLLDVGPAFAEAVLAAYTAPRDPGLEARMRWYAAAAGIQGLADRLAHDGRDHPDLRVAAERLRRVLVG